MKTRLTFIDTLNKAHRGNNKLNLRKNTIEYHDMITLILFLEEHHEIIGLKLNWCQINTDSFKIFAKCLAINTRLTELNLNFSYVDDAQAKLLAESLKHNTTLRKLSLDASDINCDGITAISDILIHNNTLESLSLSIAPAFKNSHFDISGLTKALGINQSLTHLKLSGNKINSKMASMIISAMTLNTKTRLRVLDLHDNAINNEAAIVIMNMLAVNKTLEVLNLSWNGFNAEGVKIIASGIQSNHHIISLCLSCNKIEDAGLIYLAEALNNHTSLCELNVADCSITDVGAAALVESLRSKNTLNSLDISRNKLSAHIIEALMLENKLLKLAIGGLKLGDKGVQQLFATLDPHCCNLSYLNLCGNNITDKGIQAMAIFLRENRMLEFLHLHSNTISTGGAVTLAQNLVYNNTLKVLDLSLNTIDDPSPLACLIDKIRIGLFSKHCLYGKKEISESKLEILHLAPHERAKVAALSSVNAPVPSLTEISIFKVKTLLKQNPQLQQQVNKCLAVELQDRIKKIDNFTFF